MAGVTLPTENSAEFKALCERVHRELAAKFAWTVQHGGMIYRNDPTCKPMDDKTFNRVSRAAHSFRYRDDEGRALSYFLRMQDIIAAWDDPSLEIGVRLAERVEFMPGKPDFCKDDLNRLVLNVWQAPPWEAQHSDAVPSPFLELVDYLFEGDRQAIEHFLDFTGHLVQRPGQRVNHAILLTSKAKGIGKSTLGTVIRKLVGERNSGVAQSKDLKSQFDGWLMGKLIVQVDEVYEHGNTDLANRLKPLLTEPTVSVNVKYGPQLTVNSYTRLLLFSNETAPIDLEEGDRRYFVFDSAAQPQSPEYYERLNDFIGSDEGMSAIDISAFKPFAAPPMTQHKAAAIEVSGSSLRHYIAEAVSSGHLLETLGPTFTMDALQRRLVADGFAAQSKNVKEIGAALRAAGVEQVRPMVNGSRLRLHRLPEVEGAHLPEF